MSHDDSESEADREVQLKLGFRVAKVEFNSLEFGQVIEFFRTVSGVNIHVNWLALCAVPVDQHTSVSLNLADVTVERVLRLVLADLGPNAQLAYVVQDGVVTISTKDDLDRMPVVKMYDICDLIEPEAEGNRASRSLAINSIIDIIKSTIDMYSWDPVGCGQIKELNATLLVTQTRSNHEQIAGLFTSLRRSVEDDAEKRLGEIIFPRLGSLLGKAGFTVPAPEESVSRQTVAPRGSSGKNVAPSTRGMTWQDVQGKLLVMYENGEPYTTIDHLAARIGCGTTTLHKAIKKSPKLTGWQARHTPVSPKAQSLNGVVTNTAPGKADDPADVLTDDDVDTTMAWLVEQAKTPDQKAELNAKTPNEQRELVRLVHAQGHDQHIEDHAKKGNRRLGRRP